MDRAYPTIKHDDDMDDDDTGNYDDFDPKGKARAAADATQAANKGTSDFVKKLFSMLDDKAYDSVVAWSPSGESFIVKDMNDFTKHVLPRNFRHSNFASFVRQLNKYDFHKVKNPEDGAASVGEHVWEFQHPDFVRGRDDLLENVKRKIPAKKKPAKPGLVDADRDDSPAMPAPVHVDAPQRAESDAELRAQVAHLTAAQDQMQNHILALTKQYQGVIGEMLTFQRNMIQQDQLMQNLIQYLINLDQDRPLDGATAPPSANSFLAHMGANPGFLANPAAASAASHAVGASAPGGGADAGPSNHAGAAPPLSPKSVASPLDATGSTPEISAQLASLRESNPLAPMMLHPPHLDADPADSSLVNAAASAARNPSLSSFEKAGLRVFTVGTLQPRDSPGDPTPAPPQELAPAGLPNGSAGSSFDVHANGKGKEAADDKKRTPTPGEGQASKHLRVRRSTLVPGWAVPPRVLLVDDDEVCRRLSSKFLQVFGCSIDYAVDGMSAVNKMNLEKYDLVLMDIVMPNLDGMSATSLIRQFDPRTPIISMTSNSGPSELVNYMSSGMTDILPKPFTKEGLLNMLEKHLLHLKAARGTGQEGPKGVSPAPAATPSGTVQTGADDGTLNPLAGMGFTDEEYVAMLQNLIAAGTQDDEAFGMDLKDGKRMAEESGGENKRQRFVDS
jgi:osomolarity two-component system response regulator SKN7